MAKTGSRTVNDISLGWALAGGLMFAAAIAAPIGVLSVSKTLRTDEGSQAPSKVAEAESTARDAADAIKLDRPLQEQLASAVIEPGVGIGPIVLGAPVSGILDQLSNRFQVHFSHDGLGILKHHSFALAGCNRVAVIVTQAHLS